MHAAKALWGIALSMTLSAEGQVLLWYRTLQKVDEDRYEKVGRNQNAGSRKSSLLDGIPQLRSVRAWLEACNCASKDLQQFELQIAPRCQQALGLLPNSWTTLRLN